MGFFDFLKPKQDRNMLADPPDWLIQMLSAGGACNTGINVTVDTAMQSAVVYACVRVLSETLASLPLPLYKRLPGGGKERALTHPLYPILHDSPNPEMTSFEWKELIKVHLNLRGNHYSEIERGPVNNVLALWPLHPDMMQIKRRNGALVYLYILPGGSETVELSPDRVLHIRGMSNNGIVGLSPIALAREAIGLSLASEKYGAKFYDNNAKPGGVLEHPNQLGDVAHERLKAGWESSHKGLDQAHRIAILEEGMSYKQISISPNDAQFLETRKYQRSEIAGLYRVPAHLINDLEKATFSNIEHQSLQFIVYSMLPWITRIEQRLALSLLSEADRKIYFPQFIVEGLLRGDIESRYKAYATAKQNGWMSTDDIRILENMNPLPDGLGDEYWRPLNMAIVGEDIDSGSGNDNDDGDNGDDEEGETNSADRAKRSIPKAMFRSATLRRRLAERYHSLFLDAASRLVRHERKNILDNAAKFLRRGNSDAFIKAMEEYYDNFDGVVARHLDPVFKVYTEVVQAAAAEDVGAEVGVTPELEAHTQAYREAFSQRQAGSGIGQVRQVIFENEPDAWNESIEARMDEWTERKPDKIADRETIQLGNSVTLQVFAAVGITRLIWVTQPANACPFCRSLDGNTIAIQNNFINDGDKLDAGTGSPMAIRGSKKHPPLHGSCVCQIAPA